MHKKFVLKAPITCSFKIPHKLSATICWVKSQFNMDEKVAKNSLCDKINGNFGTRIMNHAISSQEEKHHKPPQILSNGESEVHRL